MRANRYLHIAVIGATLLFLVLWQTAAAGPPEKPGNPGLPGCLAKVSELEARIEELEDMLQNFAPVQVTGQTQSYAPGDDGDLQKGVQWTDKRFTDNCDGTVTDHLTGLIWLKHANCFESKTWLDAIEASNNMGDGDCGLSDDSTPGDWRLPNVRELMSLINYSHYESALATNIFVNVQDSSYANYATYWTSTHYARAYYGGRKWRLDMEFGGISFGSTDDARPHVWPVRGGN